MVLEEDKVGSNILLASTLVDLSTVEDLTVFPTEYIFSDTQSERIASPLRGIRDLGPYDKNTQDRSVKRNFNAVEVFAFYPENEENVKKRLSNLIKYLNEGYYEERLKNRDSQFRGFDVEFRLDRVDYPSNQELIGYRPGELGDKLDSLNLNFHEVFRRGSLPIVVIGGTSHRSVRIGREQYIEAKRELTSSDIPCQYASYYEREESAAGILYNVNKKDLPFGFSLWNFALNLYGKLGGLAWTIKQKLSEAPEKQIDLAVGLRFVSVDRDSNERGGYYAGYAGIVDRFGRWIGVITSDPFQIESDYWLKGMVVPKNVIEKIVQSILKKVKTDPRTSEIFRIRKTLNMSIIRLSKFDDKQEIPGIISAINSEKSLDKCTIGLIGIVDNPSLLLFDKKRDTMNVSKDKALKLNNKAFLLYTSGRERGPFSYPIIASVQNLGENNCAFQNLGEVCNHLTGLTALHWQTAISGMTRLPAPLMFARNIAKLNSYNIKPSENSWLSKTFWFI